MIKDISIFSKQIKLSDSHIIINNTGKAFTIVEEGSLNYSFVVGPYQRRNMFFSMPETKYPRAVIVKTEDSLPSAPMDANSQGNIYFMLRPKNLEDNSEWNYKVNIQQIDSYLVHEIR